VDSAVSHGNIGVLTCLLCIVHWTGPGNARFAAPYLNSVYYRSTKRKKWERKHTSLYNKVINGLCAFFLISSVVVVNATAY